MIATHPPGDNVASPGHGAIAEAIRAHLRLLLREAGAGHVEAIEDDASFDLLGLDSLGRVRLVEELSREFAVELEPTAAYDFATVKALAHFVDACLTGVPLDEKHVLEI
jgi:acyl carrier protein